VKIHRTFFYPTVNFRKIKISFLNKKLNFLQKKIKKDVLNKNLFIYDELNVIDIEKYQI